MRVLSAQQISAVEKLAEMSAPLCTWNSLRQREPQRVRGCRKFTQTRLSALGHAPQYYLGSAVEESIRAH